MKVYLLLVLSVYLLTTPTGAQLLFSPHTIATNTNFAYTVFAVDLDEDGDMDVLSGSDGDNKISWYENDGNGNFIPHIIPSDTNLAVTVLAIDVDGDGDLDVVSASLWDQINEGQITWYENDGEENFSMHIVRSEMGIAESVDAADLDGDGDIDLLSSAYFLDEIAWYENDGNENFALHIIPNTTTHPYSVQIKDLDLDGDPDVVCACQNGGLTWYENDGNASFVEHITGAVPFGPVSIHAVDLDGDADVDIVCGLSHNHVIWYENDGSENFRPSVIGNNTGFFTSVFSADLDADGDMDVLATSVFADRIYWYGNDGNEQFEPYLITSEADGANSVFAADLDNDGDLDVLSASYEDDKIAWYENRGSSGRVHLTLSIDSLFLSLPAAGDTFPVEIHIHSSWNELQDLDVWLKLIPPSGIPVDAYFGPESIVLAPGTDNIVQVELQIAASDSIGDYELFAYAGRYPEEILGSDFSSFHKFGHLPELSASIADQFVIEDFSLYAVTDLDTMFSDQDSDALTYSTQTDGNILAPVGQDGILYLRSIEGFTGTSQVIVIASDEQPLSVSDTFLVHIEPSVNISETGKHIPADIALDQNYPNPFNPSTNFGFRIANFGFVRMDIYDLQGRMVRSLVHGQLAPGSYTASWDGTDVNGEKVSSGVFLYRLTAGGKQLVRKMLLVE